MGRRDVDVQLLTHQPAQATWVGCQTPTHVFFSDGAGGCWAQMGPKWIFLSTGGGGGGKACDHSRFPGLCWRQQSPRKFKQSSVHHLSEVARRGGKGVGSPVLQCTQRYIAKRGVPERTFWLPNSLGPKRPRVLGIHLRAGGRQQGGSSPPAIATNLPKWEVPSSFLPR